MGSVHLLQFEEKNERKEKYVCGLSSTSFDTIRWTCRRIFKKSNGQFHNETRERKYWERGMQIRRESFSTSASFPVYIPSENHSPRKRTVVKTQNP
jgi:hypothetical protein